MTTDSVPQRMRLLRQYPRVMIPMKENVEKNFPSILVNLLQRIVKEGVSNRLVTSNFPYSRR